MTMTSRKEQQQQQQDNNKPTSSSSSIPTLLRQCQRQFTIPVSSSSSSSSSSSFSSIPHTVAATLGRQLALACLQTIRSSSSSSSSSHHCFDWESIVLETLLIRPDIHPSISFAFLEQFTHFKNIRSSSLFQQQQQQNQQQQQQEEDSSVVVIISILSFLMKWISHFETEQYTTTTTTTTTTMKQLPPITYACIRSYAQMIIFYHSKIIITNNTTTTTTTTKLLEYYSPFFFQQQQQQQSTLRMVLFHEICYLLEQQQLLLSSSYNHNNNNIIHHTTTTTTFANTMMTIFTPLLLLMTTTTTTTTSNTTSLEEVRIVFQQVWKLIWSYSSSYYQDDTNNNDEKSLSTLIHWTQEMITIFQWYISFFHVILVQSYHHDNMTTTHFTKRMELYQYCFLELLTWIQTIWDDMIIIIIIRTIPNDKDDDNDDDDKNIILQTNHHVLIQSITTLWNDIVPIYFLHLQSHATTTTMTNTSLLLPIYQAIVDLWKTMVRNVYDNDNHQDDDDDDDKKYTLLTVDPWNCLQWCTLLQFTFSIQEQKLLLEQLYCQCTLLQQQQQQQQQQQSSSLSIDHSSIPFVLSLWEGISCIWIHDLDCQSIAIQLQQVLGKVFHDNIHHQQQHTDVSIQSGTSSIGTQLLEGDQSILGTMILSMELSTMKKLSSQLQMTLLLIAVAHLSIQSSQHEWFKFLEHLIRTYPYLGITFLPIHLQLIQNATIQCDGNMLIQYLNFMAGPLVIDPHCAQEVWYYLGSQWINDTAYMKLRIAVIRLYPKICQSNKRMYRRVIDSLKYAIMDPDPEIRLAVAATISDLAENDAIRDVAEVIGWIQQFLTEDGKAPIHSLIQHYAIRSLHFLTLHQELEFALVMRVLNKKLCNITDHAKVMKLPLPILEALCLLLGNGEIDLDDEEDEEEESSKDMNNGIVAVQVRQSIDTLLYLGDALQKHNRLMQQKDGCTTDTDNENVLFHIFESLGRYSLEALEVNDDDLKRAVATAEETEDSVRKSNNNRYLQLRDVILDGMESLRSTRNEKIARPRIDLARKLMSYEEDILGANFWQKRSSPRTGNRLAREQLRHEHTLRAALPSPSLLSSLASPSTSTDRAIAALFASDETNLTVLRDNADASIESSDPLLLVFAVQGFLRISSRCIRASSNPLSLLNEVRDWNEVFVSPDAMYLSLISFAVSLAEGTIPDEEFRSNIGAIAQETLSFFEDNNFQDESIGKICLGLCGVVFVYLGEFQNVIDILAMIEHSVRGYGGQQDFGAYFGVAIIAQTVATSSRRDQPSLSSAQTSTIVVKATSFIVEELLSCFNVGGNATTNLLACLKTGNATSDLLKSMERLGSNSLSLLMTKNVVARCLFICASMCLPCLVTVDGRLLVAVFRLIEAFEWTGGKGIALASVLQQCESSQLIAKSEVELIHNEYASIFQSRIDSDEANIEADGLDDIFYAVNGMAAVAKSSLARRLLVGNQDLFDDEGCATSLIACVLSICTMPALGATCFTDVPHVYVKSTESDIKDVTEMVLEAARLGDGSIFSSIGTVLLGMLSTAQIEIPSDESRLTIKPSSKETRTTSTYQPIIDFGTLPRPQLETLSEGIFSLLERCYSVADAKESIAVQASLAALESLSLPGKFAKSVLRKHLQTFSWGGEAAMKLLSSQIHGRRSVLQDGRDFVDFAVQLSSLSHEEWRIVIVEKLARDTYVSELHKLFPKFSNTALIQSIRNIWKFCNYSDMESDKSPILFLTSIQRLLDGTTLSEKARQIIFDFLCHDCYSSVVSYPLHQVLKDNEGRGSLLTSFIQCAQLVPLALIESTTILSLSVGKHNGYMLQESLRAYLLLKLLSEDCSPLQTNKNDILKRYQSWIMQCLALSDSMDSEEMDCLRSLHYSFGALTSNNSTESKHELILILMESMLLATERSFSTTMELLGMLLALWTHDLGGQIASLSHLLTVNDPRIEFLTSRDRAIVYQALVKDIPKNLGLFVVKEYRAQFSNILHRLHSHLRKIAPNTENQTILFAIFSSYNTFEQDRTYVLEATKFIFNEVAN